MVLWLAAAAALAAPAPDPAQARAAAEVERRLAVLTAKMDDERETFFTRKVGEAALLSALARYGVRAPALRDELLRALEERRAAATGDAVQTTLLARRLQVYKETGVLPAEAPDDGSIRRALEKSGADAPEARDLPLDLVALSRELGVRLPPLPGPAPRRPEPAAAPAVARRPAPSPFMPDRGRGRAPADPVPGLIEELSSAEAPRRALAAEGLAGRGAAASAAVPALRAALADSDPRVRSSSVTALGAIVPPDSAVVGDIRRLLTDRDEDVRFSARAALRRLGL